LGRLSPCRCFEINWTTDLYILIPIRQQQHLLLGLNIGLHETTHNLIVLKAWLRIINRSNNLLNLTVCCDRLKIVGKAHDNTILINSMNCSHLLCAWDCFFCSCWLHICNSHWAILQILKHCYLYINPFTILHNKTVLINIWCSRMLNADDFIDGANLEVMLGVRMLDFGDQLFDLRLIELIGRNRNSRSMHCGDVVHVTFDSFNIVNNILRGKLVGHNCDLLVRLTIVIIS